MRLNEVEAKYIPASFSAATYLQGGNPRYSNSILHVSVPLQNQLAHSPPLLGMASNVCVWHWI